MESSQTIPNDQKFSVDDDMVKAALQRAEMYKENGAELLSNPTTTSSSENKTRSTKRGDAIVDDMVNKALRYAQDAKLNSGHCRTNQAEESFRSKFSESGNRTENSDDKDIWYS